jgi:hypothetical protein
MGVENLAPTRIRSPDRPALQKLTILGAEELFLLNFNTGSFCLPKKKKMYYVLLISHYETIKLTRT